VTAAPRTVSCYVYYRVASGLESMARERVRRLQQQLGASLGLCGRLLVKRGEPNLWMEVYEPVHDPAALERELDTAVRALELDRVLTQGSQRHAEWFEHNET
jgi:Domain of unknown function (DUF4936)